MIILWMTINFLLLVAILLFFGRKTVTGMFRSRRELIDKRLQEADEGLCALEKGKAEIIKASADENRAEDELSEEIADRLAPHLAAIEAQAQAQSRERRAATARELAGMRLNMLEQVSKSAVKQISEAGAKILASEPFAGKFRAKEEQIADKILKSMNITAGDRVYIAQHDVLYVTLRSAFKLDDALVEKIRCAAEKMVEEAGGKISLRVIVEPELIGGLLLRVGDKIFDGTILNILYSLESRMRRRKIDPELDKAGLAENLLEGIRNLSTEIDIYQLGRAMSVSDGICWLDGLADSMFGELVEFENGEQGMILDIEPSRVGCVVFGSCKHIQELSRVRRLGWMAEVPAGEALLGRVVDPLGKPLDGLGVLLTDETRPIEHGAPSIMQRQSVSQPLYTGVKAIDALIPIGKGQRELIIGDRQTGKTALAIDAIINQRGRDVICIYVAIGQRETSVAGVVSTLKKYDAMDYTIIVCADAYQTAPMQYIAPYSGTAMGEYFMEKGKDVLIVYDDLSKHAVAYRELSLLLQRPSGREAYPGDVFYLHSRLLERSAKLSREAGGGSMTALPIIETQAGDISAYIPTNAISITDGQIFLESELFNEGQRPAVNVGLSVSRVGGSAQTKAMRQVSGSLRVNLAQYRELAAFAQFGADLDVATKASLALGRRMTAVLRQEQYSTVPQEKQILIIYAVAKGFADDVEPEDMQDFERSLGEFFDERYPALLTALASGEKMSDSLLSELSGAIAKYKEGVQ